MRHVLQRGGGRRGHAGRTETAQGLEGVEGRGEVAAPDVVAVDHTADEHLVGEAGDGCGHGAAHEVEADRLDRSRGENREVGVEGRVRGRDEDRRTLRETAEDRVRALRGRAERCHGSRQRLAHERRLIELHPLRAGGLERAEHLGVDRDEVVQARQRVEALRRLVGGLGEGEERDGAHEHGAGAEAGLRRLLHLAHDAVAGQREDGVRSDLGHEVVVVRVEPLRHLERRALALATGDGEVRRQADRAVGGPQVLEAGGDRAHGDRGVEHLVVVRERLGDRRVGAAEALRGETLARRRAQLGRGALELGLVDPSGPERLDGLLELTATADARVAQDGALGECGHDGPL